jgi:putative transposase
MLPLFAVSAFLRGFLFGSTAIALENLALRHQLAVLQRSSRRPRLSRWDRILWVWLSRCWAGWRASLLIVQPATVLAWHRQGFQRWKSRTNPVGRPKLDAEIRNLIRRMARENPTWGRRRIHAELALLGYRVAELTVAKSMHRTSSRPSPTWRTFLATHARDIVAIDFFLVPTLTFRLLFVFVVLRHHRRELIPINITDHPTAAWTAQQIVEAFPADAAPAYLLRDRDRIYGAEFARRIERMGIREVLNAPRAPWQNPFVERVIGSIRKECLDHFLVLNERHLRPIAAGLLGLLRCRASPSSAGPEKPAPTLPRASVPEACRGDSAPRRTPSSVSGRRLTRPRNPRLPDSGAVPGRHRGLEIRKFAPPVPLGLALWPSEPGRPPLPQLGRAAEVSDRHTRPARAARRSATASAFPGRAGQSS